MHSYDASEVKEAIASKLDVIIKDIYPEAKKNGKEFRVGSLSGEKGSSLSISTDPKKMGAFIDHNGSGSGDLFDILEETLGLSYGQAIEHLAKTYTSCSKQEYSIASKKVNQTSFDLATLTDELSDDVIGYEETVRQISEETLKAYGVRVKKGMPSVIAMPCFDDNGKCTRISYVDYNDKGTFHCEPKSTNNLFGKPAVNPDDTRGIVIVTEGQQDAMSWYEIGYPAVSIPNGIGNQRWIDDDWDWIRQFHTIVLSFDMDEKGQEGVQAISKRLQAGRCKILDLPEKDASDMLQQGRADEMKKAFDNAKHIEPEEIVSASSRAASVYERLTTNMMELGDDYFLPTLQYKEREHEGTLIYGITGHGKSGAVSNQVAFNASKDIQTMIYSPEMVMDAILCNVVRHVSGANIEMIEKNSEMFGIVYERYVAHNVHICDLSKKATPDKVIDLFTYAYKRLGINRFVVDNIMTLDIKDTLDAQKVAADKFRTFWVDYPVHVSMVAHPRKPPSGDYFKEPEISEVRGASEWGDMANNVLCVWRNKEAERNKRDMLDDGADPHLVEQEFKSIEEARIIIKKQRETGVEHSAKAWFDAPSKRLSAAKGDNKPWYTKEEMIRARDDLRRQLT